MIEYDVFRSKSREQLAGCGRTQKKKEKAKKDTVSKLITSQMFRSSTANEPITRGELDHPTYAVSNGASHSQSPWFTTISNGYSIECQVRTR